MFFYLISSCDTLNCMNSIATNHSTHMTSNKEEEHARTWCPKVNLLNWISCFEYLQGYQPWTMIFTKNKYDGLIFNI